MQLITSKNKIALLLPKDVSTAEQFGYFTGALCDDEQAFISNSVTKRQLEFAAGRTCARNALTGLGVMPQPILRGSSRQPLWPSGIVGSITHCNGYCAAAVAFRSSMLGIGIDAEPNQLLPSSVYDHIFDNDEIPSESPRSGLCVDRLLFSIKESIFKAWFPITGIWLDFKEVKVSIDLSSGIFRAKLLKSRGEELKERFERSTGRFREEGTHILTAFIIRA